MPKNLLFLYLLRDHSRLLEIERQYYAFLKLCPSTDRDLYNHITRDQWSEIQPSDHVNTTFSETNQPSNKYFRERWRFSQDIPEFPDPVMMYDGFTAWSKDDLFAPSPLQRRFEVFRFTRYKTRFQGDMTGDGLDRRTTPNPSTNFVMTISPQLLLYRLICLFGMPPQNSWFAPPQWAVRLGYLDHKSLFILGEDTRGQSYLHFVGRSEASEAALELLEWLLSNSITNENSERLAGASR